MDNEMAGVRTFRRRGGRMGADLRQALVIDVPKITMPEGRWNLATMFDAKEVVLDIGCGMGEATVAMAGHEPNRVIVAVDVHEKGIASIAYHAHREQLDNIRVVMGDALEVLRDSIAEQSLHEIRVWFPDPWPKARHHKRRIINRANVDLFTNRLAVGGRLHVATDVAEYADVISEVLDNTQQLHARLSRGPRPTWRPWTRYERRGLEQGRPAADFIYEKVS